MSSNGRSLPCCGFDLIGGREGRPGGPLPIDLYTHIPEWGIETALARFAAADILPLRVIPKVIATHIDAETTEFSARVCFKLDEDRAHLRRVLESLHRELRREL
ncbi:MAG: hypothetical protein H6832_02605 [Planctomycetes bacterium]|nr:hypothetical protein [Planctomycetota bacterium]